MLPPSRAPAPPGGPPGSANFGLAGPPRRPRPARRPPRREEATPTLLLAVARKLSFFRAIVIGLVQGVTELFPISSLGHSVLIPSLFGWHQLVKGQTPG